MEHQIVQQQVNELITNVNGRFRAMGTGLQNVGHTNQILLYMLNQLLITLKEKGIITDEELKNICNPSQQSPEQSEVQPKDGPSDEGSI